MKSAFVQTGVTSDGKPVLSGIFQFYETHGLPLDIILNCFIEKSWVPDWISLYEDCKDSGMKHTRILSKLSEAIDDSYGKEWREVVISNLDLLFKNE